MCWSVFRDSTVLHRLTQKPPTLPPAPVSFLSSYDEDLALLKFPAGADMR